jgi:hypothetical protein
MVKESCPLHGIQEVGRDKAYLQRHALSDLTPPTGFHLLIIHSEMNFSIDQSSDEVSGL